MPRRSDSTPPSHRSSVQLPNGVTLRRGSRVRVPRDLIWHSDVVEAAQEHGWKLGRDYSPGSEVIEWPEVVPDAA